jgi:catechol 2,3-dioxygenase-like lactoylglutathione lyase family enzyme
LTTTAAWLRLPTKGGRHDRLRHHRHQQHRPLLQVLRRCVRATGLQAHVRRRRWAGYGPDGKKEGLEIYLATPENGQPACLGNGSMLAFKASSRSAVEAFYAAALAAGGSDEGKPGVRGETDPPFYGAYVRDPEGNKFCAYYKG